MESQDPLIEQPNQDPLPEQPNEDDTVNKASVLSLLKVYLGITGQRYPFEPNASRLKRVMYILLQILLCGVATVYFVYTFGIWGSENYDAERYFIYYPITIIERAVWEFRWLVACYFGIVLNSNDGIWKKMFKNKAVRLSIKGWRKVKYCCWALLGSLTFIYVVSVICYLGEIDFDVHNATIACLFDAIFTLVDRLITFAMFFAFCVVMYILGTMVEEYCELIQEWSFGENMAREQFRKIKECIRSAGHLFQLYLTTHFLLLFCTFFLGVCSCFEQMEVRISENFTMTQPFLIPHYARTFNYGNFSKLSTSSLFTATFVQASQIGGEQSMNNSLGSGVDELLKTKWLKQSLKMITIDMVLKTFESLLLYLVPVALMLRLENRLLRLVEKIEDSNLKDQNEKKFLFTDLTKIRNMCKYVKTASGLKVYGYRVPAVGAVILAAFGPFVAVIIHRLLSYIHMKK